MEEASSVMGGTREMVTRPGLEGSVPKLTMEPPKPKETPTGGRSQRGAWPDSLPTPIRPCTCTRRSKDAQASTAGTAGDQRTVWLRPVPTAATDEADPAPGAIPNSMDASLEPPAPPDPIPAPAPAPAPAPMPPNGVWPPIPPSTPPPLGAGALISWVTLPVNRSHSSVRLSLPQVASSEGSCLHQERDRTPFSCPESSSSGVVVDERRSQSRRTGQRSSSEAVNRCSPSSGFHAMAEMEARNGSTISLHGFLLRKSHTMTLPPCDPDARMCDTLLFQASVLTGLVCWPTVGGAGTPTAGASGRVRSATHTLLSPAPDASSWLAAACGLNSRARTPSLWAVMVAISLSSEPSASADASQSLTTPSVRPPAMRPKGCDVASPEGAPHAMHEKRAVVFTEARHLGWSSLPLEKSRSKTSRWPP
mmetsp:Transcript_26041/g.83764  ORF Transcript_26041/g.83764 Transcript_26041/m.83764 type:complete len:421 (-) Transcript_26041:169-1431(-)